jgi:hypothetical protein
MTLKISPSIVANEEESSLPALLTAEETAKLLKVSLSWLAKARMRGEGPPFINVGRSVRYFPLAPWLATQRRSPKKR